MAERGAKIKFEREETFISDFMTGLEGKSREFTKDLYSQLGSDALHSVDRHSKWYTDWLKSTEKLPWSSRAKAKLKTLILNHRKAALNKTSVFEATQDRVLRIQNFDNTEKSAIEEAQASWDNTDLIDQVFTRLDKAGNGAFYKELAEAKILAAKDKAVEAAVNQALLAGQPEVATALLDKYEKVLFSETEQALRGKIKAAIEKGDIQRRANELYATLFKKHPNDPDAALTALKDPKYPREVAEKVKLMFKGIRAHEKQLEAEEKQAEIEAREATKKDFVKKFTDNDLTVDEVLTSNLEASDQMTWISNIEKRAEAEKTGKKNPFTVTDPAVYGQWSEKITLSPESIKSADEIWKDHGKGLTTEDAFKLSTRWKTWKKGTTPEDKKLDPVMSDLHKDGAQRIGRARADEVFGEETAGRLNLKWDQYVEDIRTGKIKATPIEALKYFEEMIIPEKEKGIKEYIGDALSLTLYKYNPFLYPFKQLTNISDKADAALDESIGIRKRAIKLLEEAGYPATQENIEEAVKQIRAEK